MAEDVEVEVVADVADNDSAQDPDTTAELETGSEGPEAADSGTEEEATPPVKTFTQAELDAEIGKRLARERRKFERERQAPQQPATPQQTNLPGTQLNPDDFGSVEEYVDAVASQKAAAMVAQRDSAQQRNVILDSYHEREEAARDKYEDFEQVAYSQQVPITEFMAQTIQASETGPELAYFLGQNIKEASRISKLPPLLQAKELGKLEAKLEAAPPVVKKTSTAPAPIRPIAGKSNPPPVYDTTDPRSAKTMTASEWIAADRARRAAQGR